jgi:D-sedoheptulose 7-phosphate isomerase
MNNIDRIFTEDALEFSDSYFNYLHNVLKKIDKNEIKAFIDSILDARERGKNIFFIGNGGSASTASHFANDLSIGTNSYEKTFRTISLCDNNSILTAIGNDFGFEDVFSRQLQVLGKDGDIVVAISASGNSPNLIKAIEWAQNNGLNTIAITAFDGGKLKQMAKRVVHVPTEKGEYGPAEDAHLILNHLVGGYLNRLVKSSIKENC